jgi:hypothetical protein
MYDKNSRGLNCPERPAESTENYPTCPECDTPILGVVTRGPSDHRLNPCGCRVPTASVRALAGGPDRGRGVRADGGTSKDGTDRDECDRCGADTHPSNTLPLADYRTLVGVNPVLCDDCRTALVRWIQTDTDYEVRTDGGQHEPTAVDGSSTESRSATRRCEIDDSSTCVLEGVEQELVEKATRAATVAETTGHERERARVATATALVANYRWHADDRDHDGFRGALAAAARDVVEATGFIETGQYGEDTSVIDTLVRAQCAATDLDLPNPEFQVEVDDSSTDARGTGGRK